ncbi:2'-hydroxybiphenyl-2-sulfinate desulfinase [Pseudomonas putida]|jgi:ABC-type nitrate/sulfonate/bicarbonate transport system substrate-binding protein|uniref:ABC transporter substrate-binding protein n=1 Tax=Pseudomonas TaxID=286 RepID=UPI00039F4DC0|nr:MULTISPECIES: ABC transporter substrate-binding protein [Pseudomonas]CAB5565233.1 2'-hydroxybiphenyl-2-sulfinate desulfinase [Pseudomonas putida]MBH3360682.1 ABC transporter substrate-binding protein [Pseudomonas guariconensis]MCO7623440.1 ABC transporter substrate-binding protein [Pseudomonas guariconensis]MEB3843187.1 ABC transporter substrate-binding protein [Pseudomonas guariconensis]MEB3876055.1 ABC transporter substrate-binding protein [Pseudomonas guariconensis]
MNNPLDTLWYTHSPVPTGLGIAVESGRLARAFQPWGTRIQALRESSDREVREAHFDHHLHNSVRHGGNIPAIWARASGRDTRVLGLSWSDEVQLIVTTADSPVRGIRDLRNRRFGLPKWANVQIDFTRAQAIRGLENALRLEGLSPHDVELVDYPYGGTYSDDPVRHVHGAQVSLGDRVRQRNNELIGLLRGDIDAIFLKGAHGLHLADEFGLRVVVDIGSHPDPLVRANIGTPRTLTVDQHLLDQHFDAAVLILDSVLRAEQWAWAHPEETRRFLARELNTSEYWVAAAYGEDAHLRLRTNLAERSIEALQDLTDFLERWGFIARRFDVRQWIEPRPLAHLLENVNVAI